MYSVYSKYLPNKDIVCIVIEDKVQVVVSVQLWYSIGDVMVMIFSLLLQLCHVNVDKDG